MKVKIINRAKDLTQDEVGVIQEFLKFAQDNSPLRRDIQILLMDERIGKMTTGSEVAGYIRVLVGDRMLIDVIRTISHEWTHEFARQRKIKLQGFNTQSQEDYANTEAGIMVRTFEKMYPQFVGLLYR